jgi:hypothetical protein
MTHELTIDVYEGKGHIDTISYNKSARGMIYFITDYNMYGTKGNSKSVAKDILSYIECSLKKNINLPFITFQYPDINKNIPTFIDGFFGRPKIFSKLELMKPLSQKRKIALSRELNKIGYIEDKKGKTIELRA